MFRKIYEFFKGYKKKENFEELPLEQNCFYQLTLAFQTIKDALKEMNHYQEILKNTAKINQNTYNESRLFNLKNDEITDSIQEISADLNPLVFAISKAKNYSNKAKENFLDAMEDFESTNIHLVDLESNIKKVNNQQKI